MDSRMTGKVVKPQKETWGIHLDSGKAVNVVKPQKETWGIEAWMAGRLGKL